MIRAALLFLAVFISGCGTTKPCKDGGEAVPYPDLKGNRQCAQKKLPDGKFQNHGRYVIWHRNGQIAVEGEFREGQMHGPWVQYDDKGKKVADKEFNDGREVLPAAAPPETRRR